MVGWFIVQIITLILRAKGTHLLRVTFYVTVSIICQCSLDIPVVNPVPPEPLANINTVSLWLTSGMVHTCMDFSTCLLMVHVHNVEHYTLDICKPALSVVTITVLRKSSPGQHFCAAQFWSNPHSRTHSLSELTSDSWSLMNSGWIVVEWIPSSWKNFLMELAIPM